MYSLTATLFLSMGATATLESSPRAQPGGDLHATPQLVAERPVAMPGETVWLAIDFAIDEGWHTYWPGINDTGFALDMVVENSKNVIVGEAVWPAPRRFVSFGDILDHGFEGQMTVLLPLTVASEAKLGDQITVEIDSRWLVCQSACILESADLSIQLPISDALSRVSHETAALFEQARARVPEPLTDESPVAIEIEGNSLCISSNIAERLAFYPWHDSRTPRDLLTQGTTKTDKLTIEFREGDEPIRGVLEIWTTDEESRVYQLEFPLPESPTPVINAESQRGANR